MTVLCLKFVVGDTSGSSLSGLFSSDRDMLGVSRTSGRSHGAVRVLCSVYMCLVELSKLAA